MECLRFAAIGPGLRMKVADVTELDGLLDQAAYDALAAAGDSH
jgi:hypothetical protein